MPYLQVKNRVKYSVLLSLHLLDLEADGNVDPGLPQFQGRWWRRRQLQGGKHGLVKLPKGAISVFVHFTQVVLWTPREPEKFCQAHNIPSWEIHSTAALCSQFSTSPSPLQCTRPRQLWQMMEMLRDHSNLQRASKLLSHSTSEIMLSLLMKPLYIQISFVETVLSPRCQLWKLKWDLRICLTTCDLLRDHS